MLVRISQQMYDQLIRHCQQSLPVEACGLITGTQEEHTVKADSIIPIRNGSPQPTLHHFMDPKEYIPFLMDPAKPIVGIFHSHPSTPAIPSRDDLQTLWHTLPTYWIISMQNKQYPDLQIYQIKKAPLTVFNKLSFVIGQ